MEKILVIGGSYFTGRIFTIKNSNRYDITLLNRGRYSMSGYGVREIRCDRRNSAALKNAVFEPVYDAVIDFCAYEPGDIERIFKNTGTLFGKYIYISTADVLAPSKEIRSEDSPLRKEPGDDEASLYCFKKMLLEEELKECAGNAGIPHVSLRPAFIYGPYNYAPRESIYIRNAVRGEDIVIPENAEGRFNTVYAGDVSDALSACIECDDLKESYLLASPDVFDYGSFTEMLLSVMDTDITVRKMAPEKMMKEGLPLPFPVWSHENELFDGSGITRDTGFVYGDVRENMKKTADAFISVFKE